MHCQDCWYADSEPCVCRDATQLMQTDGELQLKGFLATAADGIVKLSMHLDMLFMQISIYQGYPGQTVAGFDCWL